MDQTSKTGNNPPYPRADTLVGRPSPTASRSPQTATSSVRILVVEDQDDMRGMLVVALELDGHTVDEASNAHDGLKRLQQQRYNLVLSDYAMPGGTGAWMIQEAMRQGLMEDTAAVIVTAQPDLNDLDHVAVISKPLDLDGFLEQIRRVLSATGGTSRGSKREMSGSTASHRIELTLYISSASPASVQAKRNLERVLERFDRTQVKFTICDLVREPLAGEADRIAFTPTLVKRYPEPRMWVLGNLREPEILADLLRVCGVDAKE